MGFGAMEELAQGLLIEKMHLAGFEQIQGV